MSRAQQMLAKAAQQTKEETTTESVVAEIETMDFRPDNIDAETWELIQENGRLATEKLNDILRSPKFMRLRASEQAKLIALAQNRAYGLPQSNRQDQNKRRSSVTDVTASELNRLASRAHLPEYTRYQDVEEAETVEDDE